MSRFTSQPDLDLQDPELELKKILGEGTFGRVYLAQHLPSGNEVAVKCCKKGNCNEFFMEAALISSLKHPNIIDVLFVKYSDTFVYMVMEFVRGGTLTDLLVKYGKLSAELVRPIMYQAVSSFMYMHSRNIVHADIKLDNLLFDDSTWTLKVADFGLSVALQPEQQLFGHRGTPLYMAPEVWSNFPYNGPPADVWALGVVMHLLLMAEFPFEEEELQKMALVPHNVQLWKLQGKVDYLSISLVTAMLCVNPYLRISMQGIMEHPWMKIFTNTLSPIGFSGNASLDGDVEPEKEEVETEDVLVEEVWRCKRACKEEIFEQELENEKMELEWEYGLVCEEEEFVEQKWENEKMELEWEEGLVCEEEEFVEQKWENEKIEEEWEEGLVWEESENEKKLRKSGKKDSCEKSQKRKKIEEEWEEGLVWEESEKEKKIEEDLEEGLMLEESEKEKKLRTSGKKDSCEKSRKRKKIEEEWEELVWEEYEKKKKMRKSGKDSCWKSRRRKKN